MPSDAARLEALGETEVEFEWRGRRVRVPLDLDRWPTYQIQTGRALAAVELLTLGQGVLDRGAVLDDARELSERMAEAVGIERLPETPDAPDQWFGGIPTLLELLRNHEPDVASDLKRFWGVDLDDRFRTDERRLTYRKVWTYVRRLPPTSAVALAKNGGKTVWTEHMFIDAGIYEALTGRLYEGRPLRDEEVARLMEAMQAKLAHDAKLRESTARYAAQGEAQAQAGADPAASAGGGPLAAAMAEAVANRQRELGTTETDG